MNLYLIQQPERDDYDIYLAAIVAAESAEDARTIHPSVWGRLAINENGQWVDEYNRPNDEWASHVSEVTVSLVGIAAPGIARGVVLGSYKAG